MFAILVINLGTTSNTHFYSTNNATRLFTFNITASDNNPTNGYSEEFPSLVFALQDVYTAMPPASYPLLRSVQYNMILNKTVGYCAPAINDTSVTPSPQCMSGNFTADDDVLRFHIDTPLSPDWTQAQNWSQPGSPTASMAFEVGTFTSEAWTRPGHPPGATIREGGRHGHVVLKTVVTKPGDWTQLKVCIAGPRQATPELLHPEVLVPLGVLLMRQSDYAIEKAGLEPPLASY
ncbi:hypothetical protein PsYK624_117510 [Phanerochaete sordida]|uniref:Uncharacterized protein n=1 Tax=Phanerochaete sordida TaxID=48140 RepID=A0A9P3GL82_9APHY|nr:hypothetical protein PsYK624_117510 [Phanerochaete sordida]